MFEHSVKVPRHYKIAANIFKKVSTEGGSVKTLLYDNKLRHFRTNVLFALITETIKHASQIDKIFESSGLLEKETRLDPWLAKVLTAELLFGKKTLPGKSKPEQTILSYKEHFQKYTIEQEGELKTQVVRRPRYVRINTNLLTTSDAIRAFQDEGYHFVRCTSGSYNDYLGQIQSLTEYDFTQDYHVKTVFVFAPGTKLHEHELYLENKIILQDKATAMAVPLLAPPPGSTVLDLCAAPGMKTTQVAAFMKNEGKIYAVERNEQRYKTLCEFVEKTGSKCVETLHKDSLEIKRGDYDDVEYILLDPSCSGSGMDLCVHNYIEETRLAKLTSLQEKFLKHAMNSFPKAKRIVYSTCSLYPEENERVITNIVKTSRAKWRVQDVKELLKGQWNNFGSGMYGSIGTRCLYAKPESDFTIGFFLAVLDRDQKEVDKMDNQINENDITKMNYKNIKVNNDDQLEYSTDVKSYTENKDENENSNIIKKRKKKKKSGDNEDKVVDNATENTSKLKKKVKTLNENEILDSNNAVDLQECISNNDTRKKKKKKKDKEKEFDDKETDHVVEQSQVTDNEEKIFSKNRQQDFRTEKHKLSFNEPITIDKVENKKKKKKSKHIAESVDNVLCHNENETPKKRRKEKTNVK